MPGWFDINGLDESSPEDRAGFTEAQTRIEKVGGFLRRFGPFLGRWVLCASRVALSCFLYLFLTPLPPPNTHTHTQIIEGEVAAGVPAEKIVLGGFSQGGAMTLHICLRASTRLAGALNRRLNRESVKAPTPRNTDMILIRRMT